MPLWTNRYDGSGKDSDEAYAVAVDGSNNVIVAGHSSNGTNFDYVTIRYSSAGVPLWTNCYNGPGNGNDEPHAMAVDRNGNVFVTGYSVGSGGDCDFATIRYVSASSPYITSPPLSRTNAVGTTASFSVTVTGTTPFNYQWRKDGVDLLESGNLSGVTTTNLLIANVQLADAGSYTVVVTNAAGSATSSVGQLTVVNPGRFSNLSYSPAMGFTFVFRDAILGRPYRIQVSPSLAEGSWVDWMSFNYAGPVGFMDLGAPEAERRFYRAVTP